MEKLKSEKTIGTVAAFIAGASIGLLALMFSKTPSSTVCPSQSELTKKFSLLISKLPNFRIISIKPFAPHSHLCQVVAEVSGQKNAFLITPDAKWVFTNAIDSATGKDVLALQNAQYEQALLKKREQNLLKMNLDKYVAFTYYNGKSYYSNPPKYDHYIYFITDPKCPFCHDTEKLLMDWANKNHVAVKVIVLALPIHPGSFRTSVGLYCNQKGLNALHQAYNSSSSFLSQCPAGKQYEDTIRKEIMPNILGTPTFIGENKKIIPGAVANEDQFNTLLNK